MKKLTIILLFIILANPIYSQTGCISGDCENGNGIYVWPEGTKWAGDRYEGNWKNGKLHGEGTYTWTNGNKYSGMWKNGAQNGQGTLWMPDGNKYVGEWKNSFQEGQGTLYYKNGKTISGLWKQGKLIKNDNEQKEEKQDNSNLTEGCISGDCEEGLGTYKWENGDKYVGNWKAGLKHGEGTLTYASGKKYVGEFKNDKFEGKGTFTWETGENHKGNWKNGRQEGYGEYTNAEGTVKKGIWKDGKYQGPADKNNSNENKDGGCVSGDCLDGYGIYIWPKGDKYIGDWQNGKQHGQGTYLFASGSKYVGAFKNGKRDGKGTYNWSNGETYIGDWKNGTQNGIGTYYYQDGTAEVGVWEDGKFKNKVSEFTGCATGDCKDGYGVFLWKDGHKYEGNWSEGKLNGQGTFYFANGEKYEGEWKDGKRNGYGTNTYVNGTSKTGMWEEDRYIGKSKNNYGCISGDCSNGYGIYTWESGERYEGYWKNGNRYGQGTNVFSDGEKYVGNWKDGKRNGYGTEYYVDGHKDEGFWEDDKFLGEKTKTTGCVSGDCQNGFGKYIYETGNTYEGTFVNSQLDGQGTFIFSSGQKYVGEFKNGTYNGQGTYTYPDGNKYIGEFKNGKYNGLGSLYYADGSTKTGIWKDNLYVGPKENTIVKPEISWLKPEVVSNTSNSSDYTVKLCIKSKGELQNVQIYLNDKIIVNNATRGFTVVSSNCDYSIERNIILSNGENKIKAVVTNDVGSAETDIRTVTYNPPMSSQGEKRVALIIGNSSYTTSPLKNPANDAKAIGQALKELGFEVYVFTDLGQTEMKKQIRAFGEKISKDKGTGLFYFAGHGIQLNGENYLVPVDAKIEKEQDVEYEAVNLGRIMGEMDNAKNNLNIVILDACRNNPFARSFRSGGKRGLAATTDAPRGTYIAYATSPGSVAADGVGNNGLYTEELLNALKVPGLKLEDVFKKVRMSVYDKSKQEQLPWENSSVFGDFYFRK